MYGCLDSNLREKEMVMIRTMFLAILLGISGTTFAVTLHEALEKLVPYTPVQIRPCTLDAKVLACLELVKDKVPYRLVVPAEGEGALKDREVIHIFTPPSPRYPEGIVNSVEDILDAGSI